MIAIEPSELMIAQRPVDAARAIQASAEALPLDDQSVDAAMAVLTLRAARLHRWFHGGVLGPEASPGPGHPRCHLAVVEPSRARRKRPAFRGVLPPDAADARDFDRNAGQRTGLPVRTADAQAGPRSGSWGCDAAKR